jgi:hypothetical protein
MRYWSVRISGPSSVTAGCGRWHGAAMRYWSVRISGPSSVTATVCSQ